MPTRNDRWSGTSLPTLAVAVFAALPGLLAVPSLHVQTLVAAEPTTFEVTVRRRVEDPRGGAFRLVSERRSWRGDRLAVIVCDMWDTHHCKNAVDRVVEIAPRMNEVLKAARRGGALIIHAPSSCMEPYEGHPARLRARAAPEAANLPPDIGSWCHQIPAEERGKYPLDQSDGGCDTESAAQEAFRKQLIAGGRNPDAPWLRQVDVLEIEDKDAITDSGVEVWNLLEERDIDDVLVLGVHTNMCVLGRPFGLRQLAKNGKRVVLVRDMTDTMYNPERWPRVSHFRGTDLVVEHIEKFVCPTVTSDQLIGGRPFVFAGDDRRDVVVAIAEPLYKTAETLPHAADALWAAKGGLRVLVVEGDPSKHRLPRLAAALEGAEALVLSVRRQALPPDDFAAIRDHLAAGKPLLALRTSSHAFAARGNGPQGHVEWPEFDAEVLGGNYHGHHADGPVATITRANGAEHPILEGIEFPFESRASLYKASPLADDAIELLRGAIEGQPAEPVAWVRFHGKKRAPVFYTSLGHESDFASPAFQRLLENALAWALGHSGHSGQSRQSAQSGQSAKE